jgi:ubiquitin-protein ligase/DNA-directed RNA polymerase subunit RPC12/RpoP
MITFTCDSCGKSFSVPKEYAGRSARCKGCGAKVVVPLPEAVIVAEPRPTKVPMRTRRLLADALAMAEAFRDFPLIHVTPMAGDPPETYRIEYHVHGLERGKDGKPMPRERHSVEIQLSSEYPRVSPHCKMLTPIFHPNIDPATICVGDHWTAGERLVDLVIRIGQMIAYQEYNIRSPLDAQAAMWADLNQKDLPVDPRDLRPAGME